MRKSLLSLLSTVALLGGCHLPEREVAVVDAATGEIVLASEAPQAARFASDELNGILEQALGDRLPVVATPTEGKVSIILGDCALSRAAGIDVATLPRDAFTVKADKGRIFIAGRDDPSVDLQKEQIDGGRVLMCEHATLFGVYEFLERFAGVRFYFPGEFGTIVPKRRGIRVPDGLFTVKPDFSVRDILVMQDGTVPDMPGKKSDRSWKAHNWLRLRLQTESIPCMHGQSYMSFPERFHKTHPEYFALVKSQDGTSTNRAVVARCESLSDGQMCQSSKIWDEIYRDCRAYLNGESAASRGAGTTWNRNFSGRFLDVMPQDCMKRCQCEDCRKAYVKGPQFATDLVWRQTAHLANRLAADGFKDFIVTQMAYAPYRAVPDFALPSNVWAMVAEMGPWGINGPGKTDAEVDEVRRWSEKAHGNVWMWTYPSKYGVKDTPGVPDMAPRAFAAYYKRVAPYIRGAFLETECERSLFHYLNYYVFSKIAWNNNVDVEALLDEHFRLMFGAAAPEMAAFYAALEEKWTKQVLKRWAPDGGELRFVVATDVELWRNVFSPGLRAEWKRLFDRAAAKVRDAPDCARRLAFIRRELLDYLCSVGERFDAAADAEKARRAYREMDPAKNLFPMMAEAAHLVQTNAEQWTGKMFRIDGRVKPNTRYRLSGVFRLQNVTPKVGTYAEGAMFHGKIGKTSYWFATRPAWGSLFSGTIDWTYKEYELVSPPSIPADTSSSMGFTICRGTGEAWIDCLRLEEIEESLDRKPFFTPSTGGRPLEVGTAFVKDLPHGREWLGDICPPDLRKVAFVIRPSVNGPTGISLKFDRTMMYGNKAYPLEIDHKLGAHDKSMWFTAFDDKPFAVRCGDGSTIIYVLPQKDLKAGKKE